MPCRDGAISPLALTPTLTPGGGEGVLFGEDGSTDTFRRERLLRMSLILTPKLV